MKLKRVLIIFMLLIVLMGAVSCTGMKYEKREASKEKIILSEYTSAGQLGQYDIVTENNEFTLLVDAVSAETAVVVKKTGYIWRSNPEREAFSNETENETIYKSQFNIEFFDDRNKKQSFSSYKYSTEKGQFELKSQKNGVRIIYDLKEEKADLLLPDVVSSSTMENELFPKMSEERREDILDNFQLAVYDELSDTDKKMTAEKYPLIESEPLYIFGEAHISVRKRLAGWFEEVGVTVEGINSEYAKISYKKTIEKTPEFTIPIDYVLGEKGLKVQIDCGEIIYDQSWYYLTRLEVLPYFGCGVNAEEGYMLVPDGSGALIDFTAASDPVSFPVYGRDYADHAEETLFTGQHTAIPVFGVNKGSDAFVAIITGGDAISAVQCNPVSATLKIPTIFTSFELQRRETYSSENLLNEIEMVKYAKKAYSGLVTVEYNFLKDENTGYVGMAEAVRNQILAGTEPSENKHTHLVTDFYGVVSRKESFFGLAVERARALTTFEQAKEMLAELKEKGVGDISLIYHNWTGDMSYNNINKHSKAHSVLGGSSKLSSLIEYTVQNGVSLYPAIDMLHDNYGGYSSDNSKSVDGSPAKYIKPVISNEILSEPDQCLFVKDIFKVKSKFPDAGEKLKKMGFEGVSLTTAGKALSSNYNEKRFVSRDETKDEIISMLRENRQLKIAAEAGNYYTLPYVEELYGVALDNSRMLVERQSVPFLQSIIHGYIGYSGEALNLSGNYKTALLKTVEYGANPRFCLNYAPPASVKNTLYTQFYSTEFSYWSTKAAEAYKAVSAVMDGLYNQPIVNHFSPQPGLFVTCYKNGEVAVNYSQSDIEYGGVTVKAEGFSRLK